MQERNASDFRNGNVLVKRPFIQESHRFSYRHCGGIYMLSAVTHCVSEVQERPNTAAVMIRDHQMTISTYSITQTLTSHA